MRISRIFLALVIIGIGILVSSAPVFGDDAAPTTADMLNKAFDLVHQAWNPGGDPPSNDERTDLLTKALKLVQDAPDHHLRGLRVQSAHDIQAALDAIKAGDPDHHADELMHTAADQLRDAISLAQ